MLQPVTNPPSLQIAIYGKGGIGKSTLSANLSAALAKKQQSVLQVGCDPKHDSTRLLLGGQKITTALDYLRHVPSNQQRLEDVLHHGYGHVACIEAGGPEPGVGCAGRGIISTFSFLEN
jgi:nitrogenase subunit NifH